MGTVTAPIQKSVRESWVDVVGGVAGCAVVAVVVVAMGAVVASVTAAVLLLLPAVPGNLTDGVAR